MPLPTHNLHFFQSLGPATRLPSGFEAPLAHERLQVLVIKPGVLRIAISRAGYIDPQPSASLLQPPDPESPREFTLEQTEEYIKLSTSGLTLLAQRAPFGIRIERPDGSAVMQTAFDPRSGNSLAYGELNNQFVLHRDHALEDAFYGLGEKSGAFNRMGRDFTLWNTDVMNGGATEEFTRGRPPTDPRSDNLSTEFDPYYISIPFFYHHPSVPFAQAGAAAPMSGHLIDNPWRGHVDFSCNGRHQIAFNGGQYQEYIFAGPTMAEILRDYTELTGRMTAPPLWALGHHQCRWYDYTRADVEQLARAYRERGLPCDVIWLDIDYMDGFRVFTWDEQKFPDPADLMQSLEAQGYRMITIIDPGVKYERGNPLFEEGLKNRLFCETTVGTPFVGRVWPGQTVFPDFSLPETRAWWGRLNAEHVKSGIAGIWNDMNEPATFDGDVEAMRFGHGKHEHARFNNEYALLMAMGTVEGLRAAMPERRTFVLSRAGSPGIQRYAANWMGDNVSTWEHLAMSLPMALGLGISGQPFVGADIGGFGKNCQGELLARWYQCAAYTPFFRNHNCSGHRDQYPWSFGPAVEAICRAAIRERYRLLPYIYTSFLQSTESGAPVQRPLVWEDATDPVCRDLHDEFLLGDHLLVAPALSPGQTRRQVYLPAGQWRDWQDGSLREGGRYYTETTPMDRIPVFARAGAVIPLLAEIPESTMHLHPEVIELAVVIPEQDGTTCSELHEDDGLHNRHLHGAFLRTRFSLTRRGPDLTLSAACSGKGYPEHRRQSFRLRFLGARVTCDQGVWQDECLQIETPGARIEDLSFRLSTTPATETGI